MLFPLTYPGRKKEHGRESGGGAGVRGKSTPVCIAIDPGNGVCGWLRGLRPPTVTSVNENVPGNEFLIKLAIEMFVR